MVQAASLVEELDFDNLAVIQGIAALLVRLVAGSRPLGMEGSRGRDLQGIAQGAQALAGLDGLEVVQGHLEQDAVGLLPALADVAADAGRVALRVIGTQAPDGGLLAPLGADVQPGGDGVRLGQSLGLRHDDGRDGLGAVQLAGEADDEQVGRGLGQVLEPGGLGLGQGRLGLVGVIGSQAAHGGLAQLGRVDGVLQHDKTSYKVVL